MIKILRIIIFKIVAIGIAAGIIYLMNLHKAFILLAIPFGIFLFLLYLWAWEDPVTYETAEQICLEELNKDPDAE